MTTPTPATIRQLKARRVVQEREGHMIPCGNEACPRTFAPDSMQMLCCHDKRFCSGTCREVAMNRESA